MDQLRTDRTLRDFVARREVDLLDQIRQLRAQLTPLEKELIEVRRTKAALGMPSPLDLLGPTSLETAAERGMRRDDAYRTLAKIIRDTPPAALKIKELIALAFVSHFQLGATPAQIHDHLLKAYKREIEPGSIRPNLQRLRDDGVLMKDADSKWILDPIAASVIIPQYQADDDDHWMLETAQKLAWTADDDAACRQYEANERAGIPQDDLQTWAAKAAEEKLRKP